MTSLWWTTRPLMVHVKDAMHFRDSDHFELVDAPIAGKVYAVVYRIGTRWAYSGRGFSGEAPDDRTARGMADERVKHLKPHPINRRPEED